MSGGEGFVSGRREQEHAKLLNAHIGRRLREQRTRAGLAEKELANKLRRSVTQVWNYETGKIGLNASQLYELSGMLNVPIAYFFQGYGPEVDSGTGADPRVDDQIASLVRSYSAIPHDLRRILLSILEAIADTSVG
jgi:transcriptional regulator with XRE-family HTH domain